jgi:hypothetical protein
VTLRELVAEYLLLDLYDDIRIGAGHDYGCGQRHAELRRRRHFLEGRGVDPSESLASLESVAPAELADAFARVGRPRLAQARRGFGGTARTPASVRTIETWERVERFVARRVTADARLEAVRS